MSSLYTKFCTNDQHWSEQVSWKYAEINEWPLTQRISAPGVLVQISGLEESVHYAQCVVTAQLQQERSGIIDVSITMLKNNTLPYPTIVPSVCIEISKWIVCSLSLTLHRASLVSSTNCGCSALVFGPYTCVLRRERPNNFNLNIHTLSPDWIHSSKQLASWGLTSIPTPAWANFTV